MSDEVPPDVCRVLLLTALVLALLLFTARDIDKWWRRSLSARVVRIHVRSVCWYAAVPFRLLRRRRPQTTVGPGLSPTPGPTVPYPHHNVEVARDADQ